jgi:transcriptional regulator with XRE-family HTH domain
MDEFSQQLGNNIRHTRIMRGVKQRELAEMIGVGANYLSRVEKGKDLPSLSLLRKISVALLMPINELLV